VRNINIQSGNGVILSGDRQRAATYYKIAKRRMFEMKQMMRMGNLQYMKKVHYLDRDCVWVHLTSIDGADFIRIHSCSEGCKCSISLTVDDELVVYRAEGDNELGEALVDLVPKCFEPERDFGNGKVQAARVFIDWGDGTVTLSGTAGEQTRTHTYWASGVYDISAIAIPTFNKDDTNASHTVPIVSVQTFGRHSAYHPWMGALAPDRDEDTVNAEAHADCVGQGWATTSLGNGVYMEQRCSSQIGAGWDNPEGSWGFYGYQYTQKYSILTYSIDEILSGENILAWVGGGCFHPRTTAYQGARMDPDVLYERRNKPHNKLKWTINGQVFLPQFADSKNGSLFGVWVTDLFKALKASGSGTFSITVGSFDDFAGLSPTPLHLTPQAGIADQGYWSTRPNFPQSSAYTCKATASKQGLVTII